MLLPSLLCVLRLWFAMNLGPSHTYTVLLPAPQEMVATLPLCTKGEHYKLKDIDLPSLVEGVSNVRFFLCPFCVVDLRVCMSCCWMMLSYFHQSPNARLFNPGDIHACSCVRWSRRRRSVSGSGT